jgi:hypothetical protein
MTWSTVIRGVAVVLAAVLATAPVHAEDEEGSAPETWFARMLARNESQLTVTYFWSQAGGDRRRRDERASVRTRGRAAAGSGRR